MKLPPLSKSEIAFHDETFLITVSGGVARWNPDPKNGGCYCALADTSLDPDTHRKGIHSVK